MNLLSYRWAAWDCLPAGCWGTAVFLILMLVSGLIIRYANGKQGLNPGIPPVSCGRCACAGSSSWVASWLPPASKGSPGPTQGKEALSSAPLTSSLARASLLGPSLEVPASFWLSRSRSASGPWASHVGFPQLRSQIQHLKWATFLLRLGVGPLGCLFPKALETGSGTFLPQGHCLTPRDWEGSPRS